MTKKQIVLIDGYGFVFRAYHSLPPLTRSDKTPVGAVYGFTNMLLRLLASLEMSHICMIFDSGSKTFRNEIYSQYKANRPPCPPDLIPQFPLIREAAEAFNLFVAEKVGYEADDIIATISKQAELEGFEVIIISSDKDLMQLVTQKTTMFDAMKNKVIGIKEVEEKFMVLPTQVLDVLSLMGDASDNVPGIRGIGPKTAAELISNFGTLENLLQNLHEIKQDKRREALESGVKDAILSKQLITLCDKVPMDLSMDQFLLKNIDPQKLVKFLEDQGFKSLKQRIIKEFGLESSNNINQEAEDTKKHNANLAKNISNFYQIKNDIIEANADLSKLKNALLNPKINALILDIEWELNIKNNVKNIFVSLVIDDILTQSFQIKINNQSLFNQEISNDLFSPSNSHQNNSNLINFKELLSVLEPILQSPSIVKIGYKIKDIYKLFYQNNVDIKEFDDIAVMSYIINSSENKSSIRKLIDINLDENIEDNGFAVAFDEIEAKKIPQLFENEDQKSQFYLFKNYAIWSLNKILKQEIFESKLNFVYYRFERPLMSILAKMELEGILVDKMLLKNLSLEFEEKIRNLTAEIYKLSQEEFNIASPKQLSHILFEKLNLPSGKKSKTGAYSTNSDILEDLDAMGHEIAAKILEFRHISKLKSTYADLLQNNISPKDNRIHTTFSNIVAITGRLSSNDPNLQNIPIRTAEGRKIRKAFIASKGCKLVLADYSQIELRVLAYMSNIKALKEAFLNDKDIHSITASQIFGISESEVDSEMRRKAKAINFGIIYGISAFGLARNLKIDRSDAANYIKSYFETYPGIQDFMENYKKFAQENGYVTTITGRKCFTAGINDKNPMLRGIAERLAINAPIQGSAADIIKKAMIDLDFVLREKKLQSKILLQVHDELILEALESEVEIVKTLLKTTMENAFLLDGVPLKVDLEVSDSW